MMRLRISRNVITNFYLPMKFNLPLQILLISAATFLTTYAKAIASTSSENRIAAIEQRIGGRLGVLAIDTGTGQQIEHRATERFPMCSTFKLLLSGAVLDRVDKRQENLDRRISYGESDLLEWAPIAKQHVREGGMTVGALCAAAIEYSDNTAANLLLQSIGGPSKLTEYLRSLGDKDTRLDRTEPSLNTAIAGDPRDTATPASMLYSINKLLLGNGLSENSRKQLADWLIGNTLGGKRLRAGLPDGWRIGDKTGTGSNGATNDVAIVWPPSQAPILIVAFFVGSKAGDSERESAIAEVARIVADSVGKPAASQ
jgi:beta-lactamase class A